LKEIIFLGAKSVGYHSLEYLIENKNSLDIKIAGVLPSDGFKLFKDLDIRKLCLEHQIPIIDSLSGLAAHPPVDFIISVQYNRILKKEHIQKAKQLAVNLHMAPLPEYRGCNQFSYAIIEEKKEFGSTLHVMDESVDGGDILFERRFPIPENCFARDLYSKTVEESLILFKENMPMILEGKYKAVSQQSLVASRGTSIHTRKEIESLKQINPEWEEEKIQRYVRATYFPPFDPPFVIIDGTKKTITVSAQGQYQFAN
jgi:methionyl-tRNA formyltransferase